jgi:peptidoglycan/xylan/chitin deacetylase (PgdA/CDA1 family)
MFELALHGWEHSPYTQLSEKEQKLSLHKANEKMRLLFVNKSDIFIPPQNLYNNATLDSMNQLELKVFSSQTAEENINQQKSVFVASGAL